MAAARLRAAQFLSRQSLDTGSSPSAPRLVAPSPSAPHLVAPTPSALEHLAAKSASTKTIPQLLAVYQHPPSSAMHLYFQHWKSDAEKKGNHDQSNAKVGDKLFLADWEQCKATPSLFTRFEALAKMESVCHEAAATELKKRGIPLPKPTSKRRQQSPPTGKVKGKRGASAGAARASTSPLGLQLSMPMQRGHGPSYGATRASISPLRLQLQPRTLMLEGAGGAASTSLFGQHALMVPQQLEQPRPLMLEGAGGAASSSLFRQNASAFVLNLAALEGSPCMSPAVGSSPSIQALARGLNSPGYTSPSQFFS